MVSHLFDVWFNIVTVQTVGGYFLASTGTLFAPTSGVYYLSAYARCETSDCDITIRLTKLKFYAIMVEGIAMLTAHACA